MDFAISKGFFLFCHREESGDVALSAKEQSCLPHGDCHAVFILGQGTFFDRLRRSGDQSSDDTRRRARNDREGKGLGMTPGEGLAMTGRKVYVGTDLQVCP